MTNCFCTHSSVILVFISISLVASQLGKWTPSHERWNSSSLEKIHNSLYNHNKRKWNKTICIFHGVYCISIINSLRSSVAICHQWTWLSLVQEMAYCLSSADAITETNADLLSIGSLRTDLQWNFNQFMIIFIQENAFENVVCTMAAILLSPQIANYVDRGVTLLQLRCITYSSDKFYKQHAWNSHK